jgi:hypothetical protein
MKEVMASPGAGGLRSRGIEGLPENYCGVGPVADRSSRAVSRNGREKGMAGAKTSTAAATPSVGGRGRGGGAAAAANPGRRRHAEEGGRGVGAAAAAARRREAASAPGCALKTGDGASEGGAGEARPAGDGEEGRPAGDGDEPPRGHREGVGVRPASHILASPPPQ